MNGIYPWSAPVPAPQRNPYKPRHSGYRYKIDWTKFAEILRASLKEHDMTQKQLTDDLGISENGLSASMNSARHMDTLTYLSVCNWLGIDPFACISEK